MVGDAGKALASLGASLAERAAPFVLQTAVSSLAYSAGLAATQASGPKGRGTLGEVQPRSGKLTGRPHAHAGLRVRPPHIVRDESGGACHRLRRGDGLFSGRRAGLSGDNSLATRR